MDPGQVNVDVKTGAKAVSSPPLAKLHVVDISIFGDVALASSCLTLETPATFSFNDSGPYSRKILMNRPSHVFQIFLCLKVFDNTG